MFCWSLHFNGENSYLFVNDADIHNFTAKGSEITTTLVCSLQKTFL